MTESVSNQSVQKTTLGLHLPSDPRWVHIAEMNIGDILSDHAWCEQKAAATCISLIVSYSRHTELVKCVAPIVSEEWGHFRKVLLELKKRKLHLAPARKDDYVNQLNSLIPKGIGPEEKLTERLLISALIEARSCERFRLLSIHLNDPYLQKFYHGFMESEAGHYHTFISLAKQFRNPEQVMSRWNELLRQEAEIMKGMTSRSDRFH